MTPSAPRRRGRPGYAARSRRALERGPSLVGTELELDVGSVAHGGFCVARHDGRVVFVRHSLPGERVRAVVTEGGEGDRFLRADAVEVTRPSPDRVPSRCPHAGPGGCGGCDWQHVDLAAQRALKASVVAEQLRRLAGLDREVVVEAAPGESDGLGWRTRVEFAVDPRGHAGLRRARSHEVVALEHCPIARPEVLATGVLGRDWSGRRAVQVAVSSTGGRAVLPQPGVDEQAETLVERVTTPTWSGLFAVAGAGFWQVHPGAPAALVGAVLQALEPRSGDRVLDLYAGVGLFALPLADAVGASGAVVAVESDPVAADLARDNAGDRPWVTVRDGRVEDVLPTLPSADLVVLDPPRTGAGRVIVEQLCARRPRTIAYVACDPAALARDLGYAAQAGYSLAELTAYDLFPMTHHVECVAVLRPHSLDEAPEAPENHAGADG